MEEFDVSNVIRKAMMYTDEQEYPEAITLCKESLKELEDFPSTEANERKKLQLLFCLSDICHVSGNWVDGLMYLSTVIRESDKHSDPNTKSEAVIRCGDVHSKMGNWDKAMARFDEGETLVRRFKNQYLLGRVYIGKGTVHWRQGRYQRAMELANKAYGIGESISNDNLLGSAASLRASIHFDNRDYHDAIKENDHALEAFKRIGNPIEIARILNNKGEVYKIMGDYENAITIFLEGLDVLTNTMNLRSLGYLYTNLAESQIRNGKLEEAEDTFKKAKSSVSMSEDKYLKSQLFMVQALIENSKGKVSKAIDLIISAEKIMTRLNMPYDLGVIQLEYSRILRDTDVDQASQKYKDAIVSFKLAENPDILQVAEMELSSLKL